MKDMDGKEGESRVSEQRSLLGRHNGVKKARRHSQARIATVAEAS